MLGELGYLILGLILLFVPGFLLTLVLYPKLDQLDFWERIAVSVGIGVLVLIYIGVLLAKQEWKLLQLAPYLGTVVVICCVFGVLAYLRKGFNVPLTYARAVLRVFRRQKPYYRPTRPAEGHHKPAEEKSKSGKSV